MVSCRRDDGVRPRTWALQSRRSWAAISPMPQAASSTLTEGFMCRDCKIGNGRRHTMRNAPHAIAALGLSVWAVFATVDARAPLTLVLKDYATLPLTGSPSGTGNAGSLARVNVLREEPGGAGRLFV